MKLKYVIVNCMPIIFPLGFQHNVFEQIGEIEGAGFVNIVNDHGELKGKVHGKSTSTGFDACQDDEIMINIMLKDR